MDMVRGAVLVCDAGSCGARDNAEFVVFLQNLAYRDGNRGGHHTCDHVYVLVFYPTPNGTGRRVRAVAVISAYDLNLLTLHASAKVGDSHFKSRLAVRPSEIPVCARHIRQIPDFDDIV